MFSVTAGVVSAIKSPFGSLPSKRFSKEHLKFEKSHYFDHSFKDGKGYLEFKEGHYFDQALEVKDRKKRMEVSNRAYFPPTGFK